MSVCYLYSQKTGESATPHRSRGGWRSCRGSMCWYPGSGPQAGWLGPHALPLLLGEGGSEPPASSQDQAPTFRKAQFKVQVIVPLSRQGGRAEPALTHLLSSGRITPAEPCSLGSSRRSSWRSCSP